VSSNRLDLEFYHLKFSESASSTQSAAEAQLDAMKIVFPKFICCGFWAK